MEYMREGHFHMKAIWLVASTIFHLQHTFHISISYFRFPLSTAVAGDAFFGVEGDLGSSDIGEPTRGL